MSDSPRITIRLSETAAKQMQELVERGEYKNISEVVRAAIEKFLREKFTPPNVERVSVDLPKKTVELLLQLVESGDVEAVDMNDAIRMAVKDYVRRYISRVAEGAINEEIARMKEGES